MRALRDTRVHGQIAEAMYQFLRNECFGESTMAASLKISRMREIIKGELMTAMVAGKLELR